MRSRARASLTISCLVSTISYCAFAPPAARAVEEDPEVLMGAVLPLTGEAADLGTAVLRGLDLAVKQLAASGELGFRLAWRTEDSGSDPQTAERLLKELVEGGAIAVVGGATNAEALALAPVADQSGVLLLSPTATHPDLSGVSRTFFRLVPSVRVEATVIARHIADERGIGRSVLVYQDDAFGRGARSAFVDAFGPGETVSVPFAAGEEDLEALVDRVLDLERESEGSIAALVVGDGGEAVGIARGKHGRESLRRGGVG